MASSLEGQPQSNSNQQCTLIEDKDFFRQWLSGKLKFYNADEEVFLPYITSILEEADTGTTESDEVLESLSDILEGLGLDDGGNNDGKYLFDGSCDIINHIMLTFNLLFSNYNFFDINCRTISKFWERNIVKVEHSYNSGKR